MKHLPYLIIIFIAVLMGCDDRDDSLVTYTSTAATEDFIWKGLNFWYFWQQDVEDLADDRFSSSTEYSSFITSFSGPDDLFYHLCNKHVQLYGDNSVDRFSYVTSNYTTLVNSLGGTYTTNGVEFGLAQFSDSDDIFGFVKYIMPGTDASSKNIHRGDIFTGVNGTQLTINNYYSLLYSNSTYTLNMAEITDPSSVDGYNPPRDAITENGTSIELTKSSYTENPIHLVTTYTYGEHIIGYLMYTGFTSNFDTELNDAFAELAAAGVTDLVLDLRYNSGGSVNTSVILSSLVTGQFNGQLFIKQRWNDKIQAQLSSSQLNDYFTNKNSDGGSLNSLGLSTLYVLTSYQTASASELVINGLDPYIEVKQIGEYTRGKNEFSITLVDDPGNSYVYSSGRENYINPNNSWAMQPLVGRNENADGFYDYADNGLAPETELPEDLTNMGVLGDTGEPLLAEAIAQIIGNGRRFHTFKTPVKEFANSKSHILPFNTMYIDKLPFTTTNDAE